MGKTDGTIYFIAGLMMGGMVGAGIGMLMAPDDKKREEMIKTGGEILDNSMRSWKKFQEKRLEPAIKDWSAKVKDKVENFDVQKFEKTVSKVVKNVGSKVEPVVKKPSQPAKSVQIKKVRKEY
jgi:gas vesicle protein